MAEAKRFNRINDLENEMRDLEILLQRLKHVEEDDVLSILAKTRYTTKLEVESAISKATQSLRKAKGESVESVEKTDPSAAEKYNLINVPDEDLTPEQVLIMWLPIGSSILNLLQVCAVLNLFCMLIVSIQTYFLIGTFK